MLGGLYQKECGGNYPLDANNNKNMEEVESRGYYEVKWINFHRLPLPPV
tara:strand:- start:274 stop:420 length:147 start_codon:yes stop_codon:yes gene_type:complete